MPLPNDTWLQATAGAKSTDLKAPGTAAVGTSLYLARIDHVHPVAGEGNFTTATKIADVTDATKLLSFDLSGETTGKTLTIASTIANNRTVTFTDVAGVVSVMGPPVAVGATLTITAAQAGQTFLLNTAAGSVATLPAATGSGNIYKFVVSTTITSNAHKILAASVSDFLNGNASGHVAAGTTLSFSAAAATAHSIQMPVAGTTPSGGTIGDWYEFTDVAANLWAVKGAYQSGTTSTTPFSASTS